METLTGSRKLLSGWKITIFKFSLGENSIEILGNFHLTKTISLKKEIENYVKTQNLTHEDCLFSSRKGGHIGRIQSYRILREAAEAVGIENFGTHSLRKTWGYWTYKMSRYNIGLIMDTFNHSSQRITLRYIGVNQDQKDELYSLVQF